MIGTSTLVITDDGRTDDALPALKCVSGIETHHTYVSTRRIF